MISMALLQRPSSGMEAGQAAAGAAEAESIVSSHLKRSRPRGSRKSRERALLRMVLKRARVRHAGRPAAGDAVPKGREGESQLLRANRTERVTE